MVTLLKLKAKPWYECVANFIHDIFVSFIDCHHNGLQNLQSADDNEKAWILFPLH